MKIKSTMNDEPYTNEQEKFNLSKDDLLELLIN